MGAAERLLPRAEVERMVGFKRSAIYARIAAGTFPKPLRDPETGAVRWLESEVAAWIEANHLAEVKRQAERSELPTRCAHPKAKEPTCLYRHWDSSGRLLYVGIALSPAARLRGHRKNAPWFREIARIDVEWFDSRIAAMRAEIRAIRNERPLHNTTHAKRAA